LTALHLLLFMPWKMNPRKNEFSADFSVDLQEEFAFVAARAVVKPRRDIEGLRRRVSEARRRTNGLFKSLLQQAFCLKT
jgi:hypothetical protein